LTESGILKAETSLLPFQQSFKARVNQAKEALLELLVEALRLDTEETFRGELVFQLGTVEISYWGGNDPKDLRIHTFP
jgi:hypothetical protein